MSVRRRRVIHEPANCRVEGCFRIIERRWRICAQCWRRVPEPVRAYLSHLHHAMKVHPPRNPQDPTRENLPHEIYRMLWRDVIRFLNTGRPGRGFPWTAKPGSIRGAFVQHHDNAKKEGQAC